MGRLIWTDCDREMNWDKLIARQKIMKLLFFIFQVDNPYNKSTDHCWPWTPVKTISLCLLLRIHVLLSNLGPFQRCLAKWDPKMEYYIEECDAIKIWVHNHLSYSEIVSYTCDDDDRDFNFFFFFLHAMCHDFNSKFRIQDFFI